MSAAIVPAGSAELSRLAEEIRWHDDQAHEAWQSALLHKWEIGRRLLQAKEQLPYGKFMGWSTGETEDTLGRGWSAKHVSRHMMLGRADLTRVSNLPPGASWREIEAFLSDGEETDKRPKRPTPPGEPFPLNLPRNDYQIVLADPPWQYSAWNSSTKKGRVADDHYPTMKLDDILALPVPGICAKDATLLLWVTMPMLREGLRVIEAWDFTYKTAFLVWGKLSASGRPSVGFGYYTRSNAELCLLATTGKGCRPREGVAISNLLLSERGVHSAKPHAQYDVVAGLFGDVPRVELFARHQQPGWQTWGLGAPEHDSALDLTVAAG